MFKRKDRGLSKVGREGQRIDFAIACAVALGVILLAGSGVAAPQGKGGSGSTPPADPAIAYISRIIKSGSARGELRVMNSDGSRGAVVASGPRGTVSEYEGCSFSPDGRSLAFMGYGSTLDQRFVRLVDVAVVSGSAVGKNLRTIYSAPLGVDYVSRPRWSADGTEILFYMYGAGYDGIYSISPSGGFASLVFAGGYPEFDLSPDGTTIVASANASILLIDRATQEIETLHAFPSTDAVFGVSWSKDGARIAFSRSDGASTFGVFVTEATGGSSASWVANGIRFPSWSPSGDKLAVVPTSNYRVSVVDLSTGAVQGISPTKTDHYPEWRRQ